MKLLRYVAPTLMTATVTFGLIAGPQAAADPDSLIPPANRSRCGSKCPRGATNRHLGRPGRTCRTCRTGRTGLRAPEMGAIAEGRADPAGLERQSLGAALEELQPSVGHNWSHCQPSSNVGSAQSVSLRPADDLEHALANRIV